MIEITSTRTALLGCRRRIAALIRRRLVLGGRLVWINHPPTALARLLIWYSYEALVQGQIVTHAILHVETS